MQKILIIEDDPDFATSLELNLGLRGLSAECAASAEEALALLEDRAHEIHLVFMDIKLPGMDGIDCVRKIVSCWPDLTCVIMTGFRDQERIERARSAGAAEVLFKPFRMDRFLALVDKFF